MIAEIAPGVYRISVPLPNSPLKVLNSYFIRGYQEDYLIDTGFRRTECRSVLAKSLRDLQSQASRRHVILTHYHSDHSGLAGEFAGSGCKIYLSQPDLNHLSEIQTDRIYPKMHQRFVAEGMPEDMVNRIEKGNPARIYSPDKVDNRFVPVLDGTIFCAGPYTLQAIYVPGHTPGSMMLWMKELGIMFTGDHILFGITPNITAFVEVKDSLGNYLSSLEKARVFPVSLALPGHRTIGNYHNRITELVEHHHTRLEEVEKIIRVFPGLTAYEISAKMTWNLRAKNWEDFPENQKWFALGKCLSHLDYLCCHGKLKHQKQAGVWRYSHIFSPL